MNEKLFQYLWNFKIFTNQDFFDDDGNAVEILDFGKLNTNAGPDFLMAKIKINKIVFVGNIELHLKSSDWELHNHTKDPNYKNIILHVVYEKDKEVEYLKKEKIPTIELKNHINKDLIIKYDDLIKKKTFISCEKEISEDKIPFYFHEENLLNKLEQKSLEIEKSLHKLKNNYEEVLFHLLAYSFGLKINATIFQQIAESIDFRVLNKIRQNQTQLEALFFGIAGWLDQPQDENTIAWQREYQFLQKKFKLGDINIRPQFLRLRPLNFPTLRLSQLAHLYYVHQNLFSKIIDAKNVEELTSLFESIKASEYWNNHLVFGKLSNINQPKTLSKSFIEIVIINSILPLKYTYHKYKKEDIADEILNFYKKLSTEKNKIVDNFLKLNLKSHNALESQSFIYHYKTHCKAKKCLNCGIGFKILKEV